MPDSKGTKAQITEQHAKPHAIDVNETAIPCELKDIAQWVVWRYQRQNNKWTKVPYQCRTLNYASTTNPETWSTFTDAITRYREGKADGVGFVFTTDDPYVGIDLDDCRNPETGELSPDALEIIERFSTYSEVSPSGTGIKLILKGDLSAVLVGKDGTKSGDYEVYQAGRYFTMTGHSSSASAINEGDEALMWFVRDKIEQSNSQQQRTQTTDEIEYMLTDEQIWQSIDASKSGVTIRALMNGDITSYDGDESRADLALCTYIAFWFGRDYHTIERIFNQSKLAHRDKWKSRQDYRKRTINKAIQSGCETYGGKHPANSTNEGFTNFTTFESTDVNEKKRVIYQGIGSDSLVNQLTTITDGWPKRVQSTLFVREDNDLLYLDDSHHLFAWMGRTVPPMRCNPHANPVRWKNGNGMVKEAQFLAALQQQVESFEAVVKFPHEPKLPRHYYCHPPLPENGGWALDTLLARFNPASDIDNDLLLALFLSLVGGVPPGQRPAWLITAADDDDQAGRGVGKSALVRMAAALVGGELSCSANESINDLKKRLLSPEGRDKRIVLIDNVKSLKYSSSDLEGLITAPVISGYQLYRGEGRLVNTLLWCLTINGASLSKDLAQRCIVLKLKRPRFSGDWEGETLTYIETHRWQILSDLVRKLRVPIPPLKVHSRWGPWEDLILARLKNPDACQQAIRERQDSIDDDEAEKDLVRDEVIRGIVNASYQPDESCIFISSQRMAEIVFLATGERMQVGRATNYVKTLGIAELKKKDQKQQRGWLWMGMNCPHDTPILTMR